MHEQFEYEQWYVLVRLERWGTDVAAVRHLLGSHDPLRGGEADLARRMLRRIKAGLREQAGGARVRVPVSDLERHYQATMRAVYAALRSRVHTSPGARWARDLESALAVIDTAIRHVAGGVGPIDTARAQRAFGLALGE
jgi:hypothetical protein